MFQRNSLTLLIVSIILTGCGKSLSESQTSSIFAASTIPSVKGPRGIDEIHTGWGKEGVTSVSVVIGSSIDHPNSFLNLSQSADFLTTQNRVPIVVLDYSLTGLGLARNPVEKDILSVDLFSMSLRNSFGDPTKRFNFIAISENTPAELLAQDSNARLFESSFYNFNLVRSNDRSAGSSRNRAETLVDLLSMEQITKLNISVVDGKVEHFSRLTQILELVSKHGRKDLKTRVHIVNTDSYEYSQKSNLQKFILAFDSIEKRYPNIDFLVSVDSPVATETIIGKPIDSGEVKAWRDHLVVGAAKMHAFNQTQAVAPVNDMEHFIDIMQDAANRVEISRRLTNLKVDGVTLDIIDSLGGLDKFSNTTWEFIEGITQMRAPGVSKLQAERSLAEIRKIKTTFDEIQEANAARRAEWKREFSERLLRSKKL